mgnify:CR=1 FL=1
MLQRGVCCQALLELCVVNPQGLFRTDEEYIRVDEPRGGLRKHVEKGVDEAANRVEVQPVVQRNPLRHEASVA